MNLFVSLWRKFSENIMLEAKLFPVVVLSASKFANVCRIQVYNVEDVVLCVLPYHETSLFVRVVQLLQIKWVGHD